MRFPGPKARFCRIAASVLAATGLLSHGLAMLLVGFLAPASAEAGFPGYGEICTADGVVAGGKTGEAPADRNGPTPDHPAGPINGCPVCAAFAQNGPADLPHLLALPAQEAAATAPRPAADAPVAAAGRLAALSRGPPAVA